MNTAGNLIVAFVIWNNNGAATVSDSNGNAYAAATTRTAWGSGWSAQTFYAKNIKAGANTVTATFGTAISSFGIVYIHEYSGLDPTSPLDVASSAVGTTAAMSSGSVATTHANDLLFGAGASSNSVTDGRSRVHRTLTRLRQPHGGSQRGRDRFLRGDRNAERERVGDATGGVQGRDLTPTPPPLVSAFVAAPEGPHRTPKREGGYVGNVGGPVR